MPTKEVFILGAGGHAKVVIDALLLNGYPRTAIRLMDDYAVQMCTSVMGCTFFGPVDKITSPLATVHSAVGLAAVRKRLLDASNVPTKRWLTIIHPKSVVAETAELGAGVFVAALSVIGPESKLGAGVIINHGAIIDHDCQIGEFVHIAPGASLAGGVRIGNRVFIGAGARILPGVKIFDDAVVGAGAVVLTDIPKGQVWTGIPAKFIKANND